MAVQVQFGGVHIRWHNGLVFLKNAILSNPQYDMPQNFKKSTLFEKFCEREMQSDFFKEKLSLVF